MENQIFLKKSINDKFNEFHRENPNVYNLFKAFALELISAKPNVVSHKLIIERMRWESYFNKSENENFKLNNNYSAHYGRKFVRDYPQFTYLFNFRKLKS